MAVTSLIIGIAGVCLCWLPWVGWLGVVLGLAGCALAVPSITHWYEGQGYTGWGIAGIILGGTASSVGLAYQIKHLAGALDGLVVPLAAPLSEYLFAGGIALIVVGLLIARLKARGAGAILAGLAVAATILVATWGMTTADRALISQDDSLAKMD
jgi:hypothetical protein